MSDEAVIEVGASRSRTPILLRPDRAEVGVWDSIVVFARNQLWATDCVRYLCAQYGEGTSNGQ
jgi:hypothetical protein